MLLGLAVKVVVELEVLVIAAVTEEDLLGVPVLLEENEKVYVALGV